MMQKRQYVIIGVSILLLVVGYFSMEFLIGQKPAKKKKTPPRSILQVHAKKVTYLDITSPVQFNGRVISAELIDVVAEAPGKITKGNINLKRGSSFQKGDILFSIYKDEKELDLKAQKSAFLSKIANVLVEIQIDYPQEFSMFQRFFNEIKTDRELPKFPQYKDEKLKVFLASRDILTTYYTIQKNELQLKRHTVLAPFSGAIAEVVHETGTYVNTGIPVARIINTQQLEIEVAVDNDCVKLIGIGDLVQINSEEETFLTKGKVIRKTDFIDDNTQTTTFYVAANNARVLKIGQYLKIDFPGRPIDDVMEIPREAVFELNKVHTVEDGLIKVHTVDIELKKKNTVLFKGLKPGLQVVTEPLVSTKVNTEAKILGQQDQKVQSQKRQGSGMGTGQGRRKNAAK
ncbi:efflux RND transporter periplasmic adaptor subunit [Puteibacter caeruleilacunae]|nr:efflux RND transporter periplasmic adaptor subunit [Puteibacter caeruleilacunae]